MNYTGLSPTMLKRVNELYALLKERTWTKEELAQHFNINERTVREMVAELGKRQPVIAVSDNTGYRLAQKMKDYDDVKHAWAEIDSRIEELEKRKKPLIRFIEKADEMKHAQYLRAVAEINKGV